MNEKNKTSAPIGAWAVTLEIMTDDRRTDRVIGKFHFHKEF